LQVGEPRDDKQPLLPDEKGYLRCIYSTLWWQDEGGVEGLWSTPLACLDFFLLAGGGVTKAYWPGVMNWI
jgi:hypothetical protein